MNNEPKILFTKDAVVINGVKFAHGEYQVLRHLRGLKDIEDCMEESRRRRIAAKLIAANHQQESELAWEDLPPLKPMVENLEKVEEKFRKGEENDLR